MLVDNKHISKFKNMLSKMEYLKNSLIAASHFFNVSNNYWLFTLELLKTIILKCQDKQTFGHVENYRSN